MQAATLDIACLNLEAIGRCRYQGDECKFAMSASTATLNIPTGFNATVKELTKIERIGRQFTVHAE